MLDLLVWRMPPPAGNNPDLPLLPPMPTRQTPPRLFRTTRTTLTKHPDSMLTALLRGELYASVLRDEQG